MTQKNKQKRRNFNATSLMAHIKNFLNYWYGNHSPSNITGLLYSLDVEEKGVLHIKSNIVSMIHACITLLTSEFRNNFVSMILFRECNVCRLFDVQYFVNRFKCQRALFVLCPDVLLFAWHLEEQEYSLLL